MAGVRLGRGRGSPGVPPGRPGCGVRAVIPDDRPVRWPRALAPLLDGSVDTSDIPTVVTGATVARRYLWLMLPAMVGSSAVGAAVVLVFAVLVVPTPELDDPGGVLRANLIVAAGYTVVSMVGGLWWGLRTLRPVLTWLRSGAAPNDEELRAALRAPVRVVAVVAALWGAAVVIFVSMNLATSPLLSAAVGMTVALGGASTCAFVYVLAERIGRPVAARALSWGVPARPMLPGLTTRAVLVWLLGSGVALFGAVLVGFAVLAGAPATARELAVTMMAVGGAALLFGLLLVTLSTGAAAAPVLSLRDAVARVERGDLDVEVPVYDGSELGLLQAGFNSMVAGLREREQVKDLFGRYVGSDVVEGALERGTALGGEVRDVAVLFVDLVGSTGIAATRPPTEVVALLNAFFAIIVDVVDEHDGWVNKFQGDAALAVFGAPATLADPAGCALAAARSLAIRLAERMPEVQAGIGVSSGRAVAGNLGDQRRFEYTVIGDPVNEAARLTELAKSAPGRVLASETAVAAAGPDEAARWRLGRRVRLRGRAASTRLASPLP